MTKPLHVTGIGNAIVDILAHTPDEFIEREGLEKGAMMLVSADRSQALYDKVGSTTESSGGSVANSLAGLAGLGAKTAFIGKVYDDQLGRIFRHDLTSIGVRFDTLAATEGEPTATCLICVTPDAQRTMNTFLGACSSIRESDIDENLIAQSEVLYIEGYLWDEPETKDALRYAMKVAQQADTKVALSLSDTFCVDRHRDEFLLLAMDHVDILFANEGEAKALVQTESFSKAKKMIRSWVELAALTRGAGGSVLLNGDDEVAVHAEVHGEVVDTTGAGDLYAAGVLYGLTHGYDLEQCGHLGSKLAGHIITQMGARSQEPLDEVVRAA